VADVQFAESAQSPRGGTGLQAKPRNRAYIGETVSHKAVLPDSVKDSLPSNGKGHTIPAMTAGELSEVMVSRSKIGFSW
jgi:hypothetical protein